MGSACACAHHHAQGSVHRLPVESSLTPDAEWFHTLRRPTAEHALLEQGVSRQLVAGDRSLWSSYGVAASPGCSQVNDTKPRSPGFQRAFLVANQSVVRQRDVAVCAPGRAPVIAQSTHCEILALHLP